MAARKRRTGGADIRNVVVVSDLHAGCQMGLCPPTGCKLDGAGRYEPSEFQCKVWKWWIEFWESWVPQVTHGEKFAVVVNGDILDGVNHRSTSQFSHNLK